LHDLHLGLAKDDQILADVGITNGSKMMLVGSKLNDVISVTTKSKEQVSTSKETSSTKRTPLSKQKPHLKVPLFKSFQENFFRCFFVSRY